MAFPPRLVLASKNPGKIREILEICPDWPVQWVLGSSLAIDPDPGHEVASWPDVEESGTTYLENALFKARAAGRAVGAPAIAEDSGIEVDALGGEPGPRSARYAGNAAGDEENVQRLIDRVRSVPEESRTARYRCVAVCAWPDGQEVWAEGTCEGEVITEPRGSGGFGYDPIFVPHDHRRTMAELFPEEKNAISHRGQAIRALGDLLEGLSPRPSR
ncbi:MAG: RdgB/HAM1 family non-canonical purine NTP pyrophosphatase [Actinomycetota bacterium]